MFWSHHGLLRPRAGALRTACPGSAITINLTVSQQAKRAPTFCLMISNLDLRFKFLTCHISGLVTTLTLLSLRTSLPWPPPSSCSSNFVFRRRKGIHTRSPTFTRQPLDDVPVLHNACTIQQVTYIEFRMLEHSGCELATLTPMVLRQQLQQRHQSNSFTQPQPAVPTEFLAVFANQAAAAHIQNLRSACSRCDELFTCAQPPASTGAPTFCFRPCAVSFLCALLILHNSHSSQLPFVDILKAISSIGA